MRTRFLAVTLVAACVSISEAQSGAAQTKTTSPPRDTTTRRTAVPTPEKHGSFYCFWNRNICALDSLRAVQAAAAQDTIASLRAALAKSDTSVCYSEAVCRAKIDSALKVQQASLVRSTVIPAPGSSSGGAVRRQTAARTDTTPRRVVSPTVTVPIAGKDVPARIDTVWREKLIHRIDTVFVETIHERVIIRTDTVKLNRLEIRQAPGPRGPWPWILGAAVVGAGVCYLISDAMDNEPFRCWGGDEITTIVRNRNENGARSIGVGFRLGIGRP